MTTFNAIPVGMSAPDLEALYTSFYTQRLADECRLINSQIRELNNLHHFISPDQQNLKRDLHRRLRIAKRLLSARQLTLF